MNLNSVKFMNILGTNKEKGGAWDLGEAMLTRVLRNMAIRLIKTQKKFTLSKLKYYLALEICHPLVGKEKIIEIYKNKNKGKLTTEQVQ